MVRLRLVKPDENAAQAFTYENRLGDRYYLHEGKTKTGKKRYFFALTVREGALGNMPDGFEVSESINGVVSVRRKRLCEVSVPEADLKLVLAALERHRHLQWYKARMVESAIVIFEPHPRPDELRSFSDHFVFPGQVERFVDARMAKARYAPVMKFELEGGRYAAYRMTYRGRGGWSWPLATGKLADLIKKLVAVIGTDDFFELL